MVQTVAVYVIDPENQIVRITTIEPSLDAICSLLGVQKVRVLFRIKESEQKNFVLIVAEEVELSKYTFSIDGIREEFHGLGVITKLDNKIPVKSDLSIEEARELVTFHEIDGTELQHRRGLAWVSTT